MTTVLLIIHLFVTLALIGVVLIQRSEGGGLGIGSSQGMGSFMSGRGTANLLTRTTAILAAVFMALSLTLALMNRGTGGVGASILDNPPPPTSAVPSPTGTAGAPAPGGASTAPATTPPTTTSAPATPTSGSPTSGTPTPTATSPSTPVPSAPGTPPAAPKGPSVPTN